MSFSANGEFAPFETHTLTPSPCLCDGAVLREKTHRRSSSTPATALDSPRSCRRLRPRRSPRGAEGLIIESTRTLSNAVSYGSKP